MADWTGRLAVATPLLTDPNFARTVVLLLQSDDEDGALGLVLNRPTGTGVAEVLEAWAPLAGALPVVFTGGPVQPTGVMVLAEFEDPDDAALPIDGELGFVALESDTEAIAARRARAFAGHAGWGPGQLDAELEEEAWFVAAFEREDAFADEPEELWSRVLSRKGAHFALIARMPVDPSVN